MTGKVVRFLQDNGAEVQAGQPYVEVEAMKMIMPIKAGETGRITHALSPGSVISAGDLLASLELKDPSKVKKIEVFDGVFDLAKSSIEVSPIGAVMNILKGFKGDPDRVANEAMDTTTSLESAFDLASDAVQEFLRVEKIFVDKLLDDAVRDLTKANEARLDVVIAEILAHQQLKMRSSLILALLRRVETSLDLDGGASRLPESLLQNLEEMAALKGKMYGEIALAADNIIRLSKIPPFNDRVDELRGQLLDANTKLAVLAQSTSLSAGVDLLTYMFTDEDTTVRNNAIEVFVRRVYRANRMLDITVSEKHGLPTCTFSYQYAELPQDQAPVRQGVLAVVKSLRTLNNDLDACLDDLAEAIGDKPARNEGGPLHVLQLAVAEGDMEDISAVERALQKVRSKLDLLGVINVNIIIPKKKKEPLYYSFPESSKYKEDPLRRNMRPTFYHLLELSSLAATFDLERLPAIGRNAQIYIGTERTERPVRGGAPQVVFVRAISHSAGLVTETGALRSLQQGLDELERAQANAKVTMQSSSRIFLHSLYELDKTTPRDLAVRFKKVMGSLKTKLASRLLKLRVDEIEVKVRVAGQDGTVQNVRLVASSIDGEWLKPNTYIENPHPVTGIPSEFCLISETGETEMCMLDSSGSSNVVQTKRAIARRVGSTYAYDFLGLMEVALFGEWDAYINSLPTGNSVQIPTDVFEAQELIEQADGSLALGSRPVGTNSVGMIAWLVTMKTPEYPSGREIVLIANDITVQSGSFAVEEDEVYFKASEFARERRIPRVYISCNAGARIGLYEELKSKLNIKFADPLNPAKGFEYLYVSDEDYKSIPAGAIIAKKVPEGWALTDIIGTKHGIGVENLQGSGKIAGETSRAYDEIFTLSYVTGRSVGIGAYLVRLGQRVIQMNVGPIILTGYSALNKLLGREVYVSNDQLGGPQVMVPNGVSHLLVENDQEGVQSIVKWLSFVPKNVGALPALREASDAPERRVVWKPTPTPYDPRLMMSGTREMPGFFDKGSWTEYLAGWGKSVVVGRGRLGGIPMGAILVETRQVDKVVPADPADLNSREAVQPQAGQVLYPDSSYKVAQALRDFDKEGLPAMIFANWRGFSGGSRDMSGEILKFGAMIVDALREYSNPVYIYLPPYGELRGGSWVVVDPTINPDKMEMYADIESRGGILEPSGITEIKFRLQDQLKIMHRVDPQLKMLDAELEMCEDEQDREAIKQQISAREDYLKPVYLQAATEFADLHDKTGRMKAKGVIREAVAWEKSREFFYWRAKRRISEDGYVAQMMAADPSLSRDAALIPLREIFGGNFEDDKAVASFYKDKADEIAAKVTEVKMAGIKKQIEALQKHL